MTADAADWPGFRRRLRDRIAHWTLCGLDSRGKPQGLGPTAADEWAVYSRYRAVLTAAGVEDDEGLALWASRALAESPPAALRDLGTVHLVNLDDDAPAVGVALDHFEAHAREVRVTLGYDPTPELVEAFQAVAPLRARLLARGYQETGAPHDLARPPGLLEAEAGLFRTDRHTRPPASDATGLRFLGGPQGEGVALMIARDVRRLVVEHGAAPEEVLILCRSWDEDAAVLFGVLESWGLPVCSPGRSRPLAAEPAVAAVLSALRLPAAGWEAAEFVRLLRHGRFRPGWESARGPDLAARAAAMVRDARVFRGLGPIRRALDRATSASPRQAESTPTPNPNRLKAQGSARALVDRLIAELEVLDQLGTWLAHAGRLREAADALGLGAGDGALEPLWDALADYGGVLDRAAVAANPTRVGGRIMPFRQFVRKVEGLVGDLHSAEAGVRPGSVVMTTVDRSAGVDARDVFLVNLAEGVFPTREAVEAADPSGDPDDPSESAVGRSYAREAARFLRIVGSAVEGLTLAYPTRDEKGRMVLPSGFLEDLRDRFEPRALADAGDEALTRIDPALLDHPELAGSPADARARAVALACVRHETGELTRLAADPRHRVALDGSAMALALAARRFDRGGFSAFEGLLADPASALALVERFGPDYAFSASQLESYLTCPFQFFMKYVLKLHEVDDRDELAEDYAGRGDLVHRLLQELEDRRRVEGVGVLDLARIVIRNEMRVELVIDSEADPGLHTIGRRRLERTLRLYADQAAGYDRPAVGPGPVPLLFEAEFGDGVQAGAERPRVRIGEGAGAVRLRGSIDRVDLLTAADDGDGGGGGGGRKFRVIDYKTGPAPSGREVALFQMVQLPLYALAVERLGLAGGGVELADVGYWHLAGKGFKAIPLKDWPEQRARLEGVVAGAVGRLREGRFEVLPRKQDCTRSCEFRTACRVGQVRASGKSAGSGGP